MGKRGEFKIFLFSPMDRFSTPPQVLDSQWVGDGGEEYFKYKDMVRLWVHGIHIGMLNVGAWYDCEYMGFVAAGEFWSHEKG